MLKRWNRVVYATTFDKFKERWASFKDQYADPIFIPLIDYIQAEWIDDCPENFLHYHTAEYLHLNEIATSRTESAHWLLKQEIQVSTSDLLVILQGFGRVVNMQFAKIKLEIENDEIRNPTYPEKLYKPLYKHVSTRAIKHTHALRTIYLPPAEDKPTIPPVCTCNSKETAGFPCIHLIKQYLDEGKGLEPDLFHPHWHLRGVNTEPIDRRLLVQDPHPVRRRGRPRGARNFISQQGNTGVSTPVTRPASTQQSTQFIQSSPDPLTQYKRSVHRDPSSFEYTLAQEGSRGRGRGVNGGTKRAAQEGDKQTSKRGGRRGRGQGDSEGAEGANVL